MSSKFVAVHVCPPCCLGFHAFFLCACSNVKHLPKSQERCRTVPPALFSRRPRPDSPSRLGKQTRTSCLPLRPICKTRSCLTPLLYLLHLRSRARPRRRNRRLSHRKLDNVCWLCLFAAYLLLTCCSDAFSLREHDIGSNDRSLFFHCEVWTDFFVQARKCDRRSSEGCQSLTRYSVLSCFCVNMVLAQPLKPRLKTTWEVETDTNGLSNGVFCLLTIAMHAESFPNSADDDLDLTANRELDVRTLMQVGIFFCLWSSCHATSCAGCAISG